MVERGPGAPRRLVHGDSPTSRCSRAETGSTCCPRLMGMDASGAARRAADARPRSGGAAGAESGSVRPSAVTTGARHQPTARSAGMPRREFTVARRQVRQGSSARALFEVQPFRGNELRQPVADPHDPLRGMDLPVMNPQNIDQVRQLRLAAQLPRNNVMTLGPGNRPAAARMGTSAVPSGHRPAQPVRNRAGDPADVEGLALAVHHDRHHRRVAAQHPQRLRRDRAAEVQTCRPGPVLKVFQPDQHVHVRAVPAALRHVTVVEHVPAHIRQRLGLPLHRR